MEGELKEIDINLDLSPKDRWLEIETFKNEINELGEQILVDLLPQYTEAVSLAFKLYRKCHGNKEYLQELEGMSKVLNFDYEYLCLLNFYYDLLKVYFDGLSIWGCSAFVADTPDGPVHARNLDWPSEDNLLSKYSLKQNYFRNGELLYSAIGWPAYNSILSGCAPNRVSITLNTVSSNEKAQWAHSITYLIREVFEKCESYDHAVKVLSETQIMSDCILTVCGVKKGQFCVIERSPRRFKVRLQGGWIAATNDYRSTLSSYSSHLNDLISGDSCDRYNTLKDQLKKQLPNSMQDALEYIKHPFVKNEITMQHMAFNPNSGQIITELGK